eukprot:2642805-Prymnesium_polylepis.1
MLIWTSNDPTHTAAADRTHDALVARRQVHGVHTRERKHDLKVPDQQFAFGDQASASSEGDGPLQPLRQAVGRAEDKRTDADDDKSARQRSKAQHDNGTRTA